MSTQIFVNLPVKDLDRSVTFFTRLGFSFNPEFTNENATCMIVDDNIFVMFLVEKFFKTFTPKEVCDTSKYTEVLICLSCDTREKLEQMVKNAVNAGGSVPIHPKDHGFMYQHGFQDIDGHMWELVYMASQSAQ
ncbi:MAG: VOC family protein [Pseudomonadota bacterium]